MVWGERPGECSSPSQLSYVCNTTLGKECRNESDCGRWGTCCSTPCGPRCVLRHFRNDDGQCPRPDHLARVCNCTFGKVCESDQDCAGSQRCCDAGCQKRCVLSFYRKSHGDSWKSEQCPNPSCLDRVCRMNHSVSCGDDGDCGKWRSCCETPCGRRCVHPFMAQSSSLSVSDRTSGMCPSPARLSAVCNLKYGELCEEDNDCYAWQMCCNTSCGRRCVHSYRSRGIEPGGFVGGRV
ncbi:WAP four-disulfide core domain protein 3-like [Hemiscyllium ocellatum]|uniref:WAP four-disulfide core domain protein 3-like n=1 Tax=Hemiscyllium ocellatum TaxID=170820 RepID=UPI0029662D58|nr:WAP four-disulfide core domain protein 3-like [Hemiscyllium ocellatum]